MTSAQAMDVIYPLCTALFGGYLLLKIVFLIYVKRTWVVMFDAFILLTETVVLGLLAIAGMYLSIRLTILSITCSLQYCPNYQSEKQRTKQTEYTTD